MINYITLIAMLALAGGCIDASIIDAGKNAVHISCPEHGGQAFAISAHRWVTAEHVVTGCDEMTLHLIDGPQTARVILADAELDIAILEADSPVENPLPLCRRAFWGQPVIHIAAIAATGNYLKSEGEVKRLRDECDADDDTGAWTGKLTKTTASAEPGWSGGPVLGYSIRDERTCVLGITVAGDSKGWGTWFVPSRAIRENNPE